MLIFLKKIQNMGERTLRKVFFVHKLDFFQNMNYGGEEKLRSTIYNSYIIKVCDLLNIICRA